MGERERGWRSGLSVLAVIPLFCCCVLVFSGCQGSAPVGAGQGQADPAQRPSDDNATEDDDIVSDEPDDGPTVDEQPIQDDPDDAVADNPDDIDDIVEPEPDDDDVVVAGDLTGDAAVTSADRDYFLASLNTKAGESGFDPALDYDGDDVITLQDYQVWYDLAYAEP